MTSVSAASGILTKDEITRQARNAFAISWLNADDRVRYLDALEEYAD